MRESILEMQGVTYEYAGGFSALREVNLRVTRGSRTALLGANGSGKTTLLAHLNGTLRPASGRVVFNNRPVEYSRHGLASLRQKVGLIFQDPDDQLFSARVYQDVSFGPMNLRMAEADVKQCVNDALKAMEIEELWDRPTHMLSYGQKKRVAIAGVLAMNPEVVLLDEPTAGLDHDGTEKLIATLDALHTRGTTLLLATHDIDLAYRWADEVAVVSDGAIVQHGTPEAVLCNAMLVTSAQLNTPLMLEISVLLRELGGLAEEAPFPRTREEMLTYLRVLVDQRAAGRSL
ncbi:ATP-binding cassette domain-containing protein [bacterium]|nr:ATP-binding cassette domain-containing protein [bacterium]